MSRRLFMVISLVIFFIGLFIVFSSVSWGYNAANAYLRSQGSSMDSTQFAIILQENINNRSSAQSGQRSIQRSSGALHKRPGLPSQKPV